MRVKSVMNTNLGTVTTYFVGNHYEVVETYAGTQVTKYYFAGTQRIAMRKNGVLNYMIGDHLGSTSIVTDDAGNIINQTQYKAWGEVRYQSGSEMTKYQFTGQFSNVSDFGLMYYGSRWYDSSLGRFAQADSIVPGGVQGLDRYAYVNNSPVNYTDPSGHSVDCGLGESGCDNKPTYMSPGGGKSSKDDEVAIDEDVASLVDTFEPPKDIFNPNLIFNPFANDERVMNCQTTGVECIIFMPLVRGRWDWSKIDWKTTGIDSASFLASLVGLKYASDSVKYTGKVLNTGSLFNTSFIEYKERGGNPRNLPSTILNTNTLLSVAGYIPTYGAIPSGISVLNDLSKGYWEEVLPVYGPPTP